MRPKPAAARAHTAKLTSRTVRAIPNGGYVLPDGHFRVTGDARMIVDFTLSSRCATSLALPPIRIEGTGAFAFVGYLTGSPWDIAPSPPATAVRIKGRFLSSREARGTTQVSHGGCRDTTISFVARLS
ncbi:MAG: hypothetical protein M3O94_10025 [Actinomycetota bacterium]|nr:hypothetical protein [Actinomycetota bacterium]